MNILSFSCPSCLSTCIITDPTTPCVRVGKVSCFLTKDQIPIPVLLKSLFTFSWILYACYSPSFLSFQCFRCVFFFSIYLLTSSAFLHHWVQIYTSEKQDPSNPFFLFLKELLILLVSNSSIPSNLCFHKPST